MSIIRETRQRFQNILKAHPFWFDITLLLLLILFILSGISLVPFHGDETAYLILSEDYDKVVKDHDVEEVLFDPEGKPKQYLRLSTGSITAFAIGFARDVMDNEDPINKWFWGSSWEENIAMGNMPSSDLLNLARACSAGMGAISIVLFFLLARDLFASRSAAWLSVLAFATQGSVLVNIRRAMQEGPKFLFLILTAWTAVRILKNLDRMNVNRLPYALLGVISGVTLAAKQDTAPMLVAIYVALALIPVWKKAGVRIILINALCLGAATLLAYASFLACMPVFWSWWESVLVLTGMGGILFQMPLLMKNNLFTKPLMFAGLVLIVGMTIISPPLWSRLHIPLGIMIEQRESTVDVQVEVLSDQNAMDFANPINRLTFLLKNMVSSQVMYSEVANFDVPLFHRQVQTYEDSPWSGRTRSFFFDAILVVFAVVGGWALIYNFKTESLFVYSLLLISGILLYVTIPLPWQRYVLILQIPYLLFAGAGGLHLWRWATLRTAGNT